jgi:hypothetical protein
MRDAVRICTTPSSATAGDDCRGGVLISGSYGGKYNAFHAGRRGLRGVVLNDAGVGKDCAGTDGLEYLDGVGLAAATADAWSCHVGDGDHMLAHGVISFVNHAARQLGCSPGQSVETCARLMAGGPVIEADMPPVPGGKRHLISLPGELPVVTCLDAAPLLEAGDTNAIVVTGSHAGLFRGKPDDVIGIAVRAIFFSDAGVGLDGAGIARLPLLDERGIAAGTAAAVSARIGDALSIYADGELSHVNETAANYGARPGMPVRDFIVMLRARWRPT